MSHSDTNDDAEKAYRRVVRLLASQYEPDTPPAEIHEAARNFIGWTQILIEISRAGLVDSKDEPLCD